MISGLGFQSNVTINDRRTHNNVRTVRTDLSVHKNLIRTTSQLKEHPEKAQPGDVFVTQEEGSDKRNVIIITGKDRKGNLTGFCPTEPTNKPPKPDMQNRWFLEKDFKNVIEAYTQNFEVQDVIVSG